MADKKQRLIETLVKEGFLDNIRSQIHAQVVKNLEAEKKASLGKAAKYIKPLSLSTTRKVVQNMDGLLCAELIREFLTFYKMEHTLSVFVPEMSLNSDFAKSRDEISRECGLSRGDDEQSKPLLLNLVNKVRIGDFAPPGSANKSPGTDEMSSSPNQMKPAFGNSGGMHQVENYDHTPPTTGIMGSGGEVQNSRKNTRNLKSKQSRQDNQMRPRKGGGFDDSNSSEKQGKQDMASLKDLPGLGPANDGFYGKFDNEEDEEDSFGNQNPNGMSRFQNAEKFLDEYENEEKEGFKVEVKRPGSKKAMPNSSGKKNKKAFGNKFAQNRGEDQDEDSIEEEIQTEREKESMHDGKIESSLGHQAGITVSQSLGIDPSVDSLAIDDYDHVEVVEI